MRRQIMDCFLHKPISIIMAWKKSQRKSGNVSFAWGILLLCRKNAEETIHFKEHAAHYFEELQKLPMQEYTRNLYFGIPEVNSQITLIITRDKHFLSHKVHQISTKTHYIFAHFDFLVYYTTLSIQLTLQETERT